MWKVIKLRVGECVAIEFSDKTSVFELKEIVLGTVSCGIPDNTIKANLYSNIGEADDPEDLEMGEEEDVDIGSARLKIFSMTGKVLRVGVAAPKEVKIDRRKANE